MRQFLIFDEEGYMPVNLINVKSLDNFLLSFLPAESSYKEPSIAFAKNNVLKTNNAQQVEDNKEYIAQAMVKRFFLHNLKSFLLSNNRHQCFETVNMQQDLPKWAAKYAQEEGILHSFCEEKVSLEFREDVETIYEYLHQSALSFIDKRVKWFYSSDKQDKKIKINIDSLKTVNEYSDFDTLLEIAKKGDAYKIRQEKRKKEEADFLAESLLGTSPVMMFDSGMSLVHLQTNKALRFESREMKHCVGEGEYDIRDDVKGIDIYSLRDIKGHPHITLEVRNGKLCQCKGNNNQKPKADYLPYVRKFIMEQNIDISGDIKFLGLFKQDGKYYDFYNLPENFIYKGMLDLSNLDLEKLPDLSGVEVMGTFICRDNSLTSLIGAPKKVHGSFYCNSNRLTSLEGAPQYVGEDFYCTYNKLEDLQGSPQYVGGSFVCMGNRLQTLKGAPKYVGGNFDCSYNKLEDLEYLPQIKGELICDHNLLIIQDNKVYNLYKLAKGFIIKGNLDLSGMGLTTLPDLSDVVVEGDFNCSDNKLTSLKGAPKKIGGDFDFSKNNIHDTDMHLGDIGGQIKYDANPFVITNIEMQRHKYRRLSKIEKILEEKNKYRAGMSGFINDASLRVAPDLTSRAVQSMTPEVVKEAVASRRQRRAEGKSRKDIKNLQRLRKIKMGKFR